MTTEGAVLGVIRSARPSFRSPHDRVAFAVHAAFLAAGYSLTAVGPRVDSSSQETSQEDVGIDGWNDADGAYAFRYSSPTGQSVTVKCISIDDILMVDVGHGDGAALPFNLDIKVLDYTTTEDDGGGVGYGGLYKDLHDLVSLLNSHVLSNLENKQPADASSSKSRKDAENQKLDDIRFSIPESSASDEHPNISGVVYPPIFPAAFNDRFPGPGAGVFPVGINTGPDGGMLVGPNDRRWGVNVGPNRRPQFPDSGIEGIPPGARFDPFGPPGVPGFEPGRFIRRPPGAGTHPDLEHFSPF